MEDILLDPVQISHQVATRLGVASMAFDFVVDNGKYLLVEICYAYQDRAVHTCSGYFDRDLNWYEGQVWPQDAILDDLLATL
jgi:hypothetical protein